MEDQTLTASAGRSMSANSITGYLKSLTDAAADRAGRTIADLRRQAEAESQAREDRFQAKLALVDTHIERLARECEQAKAERERFAALNDRLEQRLETVRDGKDGEPGRDGKDVDMEAVEASLSEMVAEAFKAIPAPKDGRDGVDGKDADEELIFQMLAERVDEKIAAIPLPKDGKDGADGKDGRDGLDAVSFIRDAGGGLVVVMSDGSTRDLGRIVGEKGDKGDAGEPGPPGADGRDGQDAYPGEAKGLYDPAASYLKNDTVTLNGSEWRAKRDDPGECPGDGWALSAQRGKRGEKGDAGEKGDPGSEVEIKGTTLIVTKGDGTIDAHDLQDLLARKE